MPQNPLSYVPLGRDNTGAATVFQPFDSSGIWNTYDKLNAQPKKPLLDSFGKPIELNGAGIHPNDIPYVTEAKNKYFDRYAKIMEAANRERRDINAQENAELSELKMDVQNRLSLAQQQFKQAQEDQKKIAANPYGYPQGAADKIWERFNVPMNQGRTIYQVAEELPVGSSNEWLASIGGQPWKNKKVSNTNAEGATYATDKTIFDEEQARKDFRERVVPNLETQKGREFIASLRPALLSVAPDFDNLPQDQQAELMYNVGENYYVNLQKSRMPKNDDTTIREASVDKTTTTNGGRSTGSTTPAQPLITRSYVQYSGDNRIIEGKGKGDKYELVDVLEIPVAGRFGQKVPGEEAQLYWQDENGEKLFGDLVTIKQYKDPNGSWGDRMWGTLKYKDGDTYKTKQIDMTGYNREQFKSEYGYDPVDYRDKKFPTWKEQFDTKLGKVKSPETSDPFWSTYSDAKKKMLLDAYKRRLAKAQKKTESTTEDPDAQYKRK